MWQTNGPRVERKGQAVTFSVSGWRGLQKRIVRACLGGLQRETAWLRERTRLVVAAKLIRAFSLTRSQRFRTGAEQILTLAAFRFIDLQWQLRLNIDTLMLLTFISLMLRDNRLHTTKVANSKEKFRKG